MPTTSAAEPRTSRADVAACRASLRGGSRTFFAASLILPGSLREPAAGLYAFCRMADDAIDEGLDRGAALAELHLRLDRIYAGRPLAIAADRAFADCVLRFDIPAAFPLALLEGFAWDAESRRYEDLSQLTDYAVRVAGTVGAMMAMVMNVRDPQLIARACDLGVAMQFTNIARDVGEDARRGRLYLPQSWLREADLDPDAWMSRPVFGSSLAAVIERLLKAAERLYRRSDDGLARLPPAYRTGMLAARLMYAEIGREVERRGYDSVGQRAVVSWRRKAKILADAFKGLPRPAVSVDDGRLPEAEFLLSALPAGPTAMPRPDESPRERARWPGVEQRVAWLVDLFERLERRDRAV